MIRNAIVIAALLLAPLEGHASVSFRFLFWVNYSDAGDTGPNGLTEDYWTSMPMQAAMRGAFVWINKGTWTWTGYLTQSGGYTPTLTPTGGDAGTYNFMVWSDGVLHDTHMWAMDPNGFGEILAGSKAIGGSGTYNVTAFNSYTAETQKVFQGYCALAWALNHHDGGMHNGSQGWPNVELEAYIGTGHPGCNPQGQTSCSSPGIVYLDANGQSKKFIIAHELGHVVGEEVAGSVILPSANVDSFGNPSEQNCYNDAWFLPGNGGLNTPWDGHSMRSNEDSRTAAAEGFAHFYAADTWNDDSETDCWFEYYKTVSGDSSPGVDCEFASTTDFNIGYRRNVCDLQSGAGTELDWLRTFWDVHTNGSTPPSLDYILSSFIGGATPWDDDEAFTNLDSRANQLNGSLNTNWDVAAKNYNAQTNAYSNRICYPTGTGSCP